MRVWLLVAVLLAVSSGIGAAQDPPPSDPALVQRFINGDTVTRKQIASSLSGAAGDRFRVDVLRIGAEHNKLGRTKEAIHAFEAALEGSALFNAPKSELSALINLGMVYGQTGDYATAVRYLNAALEKAQSPGDDDLIAAAANNLGNVYRRRGEYDKALEMQQRVLASHLAATPRRDAPAARTLNNIGMIYQAQGNFQQAIDYYIRSLDLKEKLGAQDDLITTVGNIGDVYYLQGNSTQSVEYFERALALAEKSGNVRMTIGMLGNIGRVLSDAGRLDAAAARLTRAQTLAEQAGYSEQLANTLTALGNVEIERRHWPQAIELLSRARTLATEVGDPAEVGQVLLSLAKVELERDNPKAAVAFAQQGRETLAAIGRSTALLDAEVIYGEALTSARQWNEAIATFERAIALTERGLDLVAGDTEDRFRFLESSANAYIGVIHAYAAAGRAGDALMAAERGRARTLLDLLSANHAGEDELSETERERRIEIDTARSALNERIAAERQRAGKGARPDPALAAEIDRLRRSRDELYLGLDAKHPGLRFARGEAPVLNARELAAQLPAKTALVEFVVGARGAWIVLLAPQGRREPRIIARQAGLPAERISSLAAEFTHQVSTRDLSFSANARALYEALFGPIESELTPFEQLIVVPHGSLWEVPFEALRTPRQKYLVEERAIAYAPSASALKALTSRRRPRSAEPRVIAFGDPRLNDPKAAPLPNAAREAREVAAVYGTTAAVVTEADATEARFRQLAPNADIVHIATHGILDDASPLFSYVMLSGSGQNRAADGKLEGRELINMQLNAELVVLSACDTARGRIANGEGVIGLSWALFAAGASTTTVSLWPVDSASTTELMSSFHRERRRLIAAAAPAATAQALRAAQLRALGRPESRHPFYWAGFVVIGVP
jgi:CHAT domain-containing protein/Tfp pilus assembly protein PilF